MPVLIDTLRSAATRSRFTKVARTLSEARTMGLRTVFLCHSHKDADLVQGLITLLAEGGWQAYVDWEDTSMPENPTQETAQKIQAKIRQLDYFMFLATPNSMTSRWCPWEIGYADGQKSIDTILIFPTSDRSGNYYGNEYLQLYRKVDNAQGGGLGVWHPGRSASGVLLKTL